MQRYRSSRAPAVLGSALRAAPRRRVMPRWHPCSPALMRRYVALCGDIRRGAALSVRDVAEPLDSRRAPARFRPPRGRHPIVRS